MTDEMIKEVIRGYVNAEMELLPDTDKLPEHPPYSRRFNRKMKRIKRAGDYFGGHLKLYNTLSRVAAAVVIVVCLGTANQVSGTVFGINPWKEVTSIFHEDTGMEQRTYERNDSGNDGSAEKAVKPVSDVPIYIPEGYAETDKQENSTTIAAQWQKTEKFGDVKGIAYSRDVISEGDTFIEDTDYDEVQTTDVMGYIAKIYYKSDRVWISWADDEYMYTIWTNDIRDAKRMLKRMSESLYQEK